MNTTRGFQIQLAIYGTLLFLLGLSIGWYFAALMAAERVNEVLGGN